MIQHLPLACSSGSKFRSARDAALLKSYNATRPNKPVTAPRLVALRDAFLKRLPRKMAAAIRRLRGTPDYAGAVRNASWWVRRDDRRRARFAASVGLTK